MDRMPDGDKLDALWVEYRNACPDPEAGAGFMPGLWQRIEARRSSNLPSSAGWRRCAWWRRWLLPW